MLKTPLQSWIDANRGNENFPSSLLELLRFACVEWIRRERGRVLTKDEALSLFLSAVDRFPVGEWVEKPVENALEIADFCEKSKVNLLPESVAVEFPRYLDLRGVVCPGNSVRSRLVMAGLPDGFQLKIALDEGSPIENVPQSLVADGHKVIFREKKADFWEITVVKRSSML